MSASVLSAFAFILAAAPASAASSTAASDAPKVERASDMDRSDKVQLVSIGGMSYGNSLGYTRSIAPDWAITARVGQGFNQAVGDSSASGSYVEGDYYSHTRVELGADHLPGKNGLAGFYVGPRLSYNIDTQLAEEGDDARAPGHSITASGIVGRRFISKRGATLSFGAGVAWRANLTDSPMVEDVYDVFSPDGIVPPVEALGGMALVGEINVGWAF